MLVLDVLQVRLAEVVDADALRELVAEQRARRLGEQNLAAVPGGADPRRAHDVQPDVALVADGRLAGVQPHPHADLRVLGPRVVAQRALGRDGRLDGGAGAREREEERVALRVHLRAALLAEAARG